MFFAAPRARADEGTAQPSKVPAFTLPAEKTADIAAHFRQRREYLRERDERRADDEEQRVRQLKDELAIENLFSIGGALVRESHDALAAGSPSQAIARCKLAVELAPAMAEAHLCLVRAILADNPAALQPASSELSLAVQTGLRDPRLSRALFANVLAVSFLGLLAAGAAFVLLLFARYVKLYAHDVQHLFPSGARRWQAVLLGAAFVLLPLLLHKGALPLVFTALCAVALYFTFAELLLTVLLLGVLAAAPFAAESIAKVASFSGAATDVWLVEHGEGSRAQIARLQKRLETGNDFAVDFALAHKAKRDGDLASAEKLYQRAIEAGSNGNGLAAAHNDLGNVLLLEGDGQRAQAQYQEAIELRESAAAPHFNSSRALGLKGGVEALEKVQAEQARANELDRGAIHDFVGDGLSASHKSNKFVLDMPLDDELLSPLFETEERTVGPAADEVRARLSYGLPEDAALLLPAGFALIVLVLFSSRKKLKPSGACERCGREVCRRCDPDARPSERLCAQCVNVFIRRTGVEPQERVRKEIAAGAYQRRRQVLARLMNVVAGAGHVLAGHPLRGIVYLCLTSSLVFSVVLWHGLAHGPVAVRSEISLFRIGLTAAAFIAVYAVCLRDLFRRQHAEESA